MSVRISATDWLDEDGVTPDEAVLIAKAFADAGADLIDVSAGQTSTKAKPVYGRMFQTPFSDRIRNEAGLCTMAVGNIYEADHANSILMAGRADLVAVGRPHLANPYWTFWWATVGVTFVMTGLQFGALGVVLVFIGHILSDLAWYSLVSFGVAKGRNLVSDRVYRGIIMACGAVLVVFGLWFLSAGAIALRRVSSS